VVFVTPFSRQTPSRIVLNLPLAIQIYGFLLAKPENWQRNFVAKILTAYQIYGFFLAKLENIEENFAAENSSSYPISCRTNILPFCYTTYYCHFQQITVNFHSN